MSELFNFAQTKGKYHKSPSFNLEKGRSCTKIVGGVAVHGDGTFGHTRDNLRGGGRW